MSPFHFGLATKPEQWYKRLLSALCASIPSSSTFFLDSRSLPKLIIVNHMRGILRRGEQRLDQLEAYLLPVGQSNHKTDAALQFTLDLEFAELAGDRLRQFLMAL